MLNETASSPKIQCKKLEQIVNSIKTAWWQNPIFCERDFRVKGDIFIKDKYISDVIDLGKVKTGEFNLISSGCGTGKSYFVMHQLLEQYPDVKPEEIIIVTSRALAADQQARDDGVTKYRSDDRDILNFWNGDDRGADIFEGTGGDIRIMTYDKFIYLLDYCNEPERVTLCKAKIVVFDECHTIFSDSFIDNIGMIRLWIYEHAKDPDKIILGLTATPGIVIKNKRRLGVRIHRLNDEVFMKHQAKQLICTNLVSLPNIIKTLPGKTLVMCNSIKRCEQLAKQIPDSFVLVSATNREYFTSEMSWVRDHISKHAVVPDKRWVPKFTNINEDDPLADEMKRMGRWVPVKVLIATSTVREGFNLIEASGVRNIVSCLSDDLHVIQVAGRARYDLDNLVVATALTGSGISYQVDPYLQEQRNLFRGFMRGENDGKEWFSHIEHIVQHGFDEIKVVDHRADDVGFRQWLDEKWLTTGEEEKRLYQPEDRGELVRKCLEYHMVNRPKSKMSFQQALKACVAAGYTVTSGMMTVDGQRVTYKVFRKNE